jgi:alkanesulfonate monooxygenase SsuD/methylene tetrahydromethanopterin reductase-like flavin-dependent oxidoreductase (luciferase family)
MGRRFQFGICTDQNMTWPKTVERWQLFEQMGFESAWLCDHLIQPSRPQGPYFEAWTLLAALAARTQRIRIGVLVTSNTFRYPSVLAKEVVTVDHISEGRLDFGFGAGWYEPEHRMFGIPWPDTKELVGRFREAVELIDVTLRNDTSSYEGKYYRTEGLRNRPAPVQQPRPPFLLGAFGPKMLKIIARYAECWNAFGTPQEMRERNQLLDEYCHELGRDPETLDRSLYYWVPKSDADPWISEQAFHDVIGPYVEAGINQFIFDQPSDEQFGLLEKIAGEVIPKLREQSPGPTSQEGVSVDTSQWRKPQDHIAS